MADATAHDDHRPAAGFLCVAGKFLGDPDRLCRRNTGDGFLPCRGVLLSGVVIAGGPFAGQAVAPDRVMRQHQVEHRAHQMLADPAHGYPAARCFAVAVDRVEAGQIDRCAVVFACCPCDAERRYQRTQVEVPLSDAVFAVAEPQRSVWHDDLVGNLVEQRGFERRVLDFLADIGCGKELSRHHRVAALVELDQKRQIGVAADVIYKERNMVTHIAFRQNNVAHRHGERGVRTGGATHPLVRELGVIGVIRAHHNNFGATVARFGHPVSIRGSGDRDVGTPHHQIRRVPPIAGFGHIGLVAEHLRRRYRQVGVPVIERRHHATQQGNEPRARGMADHRHRRDRREAGNAVRTVGLDGVHVGRRDHLAGLGPSHPDQPALAAGLLVATPALGIGLDVGPGQHGITQPGFGLAVHLDQHAAGIRIAHSGGRIAVPGERGTPGAPPRLVFGPVRADGGIVGLLGLPGDDPVLDVDLPRARSGAIDAVRRANHLVVAPSIAVKHIAFTPAAPGDGAHIRRELTGREESPTAFQ